MEASLRIVGSHAYLASEGDRSSGISAAINVFSEHNVDPIECAAANGKLERNELLSREEALLCLVWATADDKLFRAVTLGWLIRDIDIRLAVG